MKDNLMIKKYNVVYDNGTKNMKTNKSFFGTKLIDIEDNIIINNISIKYSDYFGYQYYNPNPKESEKTLNLSNLKKTNHSINIQTQNNFNLENNTIWVIKINIIEILKQYLFAKIKESRTFKTIKPENTKDNAINLSIYHFIESNILSKYTLDKVDLFIKYNNILNNNIFDNSIKYNPIYDDTLNNENLLKNNDFTIFKNDEIENLTPVKLIYNQTKNSNEWNFNYYFNLIFKRI